MGRYGTTTKYLLDGLFDGLESISKSRKRQKIITKIANRRKVSKKAVEASFHRAVKNQLVEIDNSGDLTLTTKGKSVVRPFKSKYLDGSVLMVIFDIPEESRQKRDHLRRLLIELEFEQIQRSVWTSTKDHKQFLVSEIEALQCGKQILIYEAKQLIQ